MMWWCVTILSAACLATCLSSFSWGRSVQSLPLQQETTFSNLISNNVLGKSEQKWYQNELTRLVSLSVRLAWRLLLSYQKMQCHFQTQCQRYSPPNFLPQHYFVFVNRLFKRRYWWLYAWSRHIRIYLCAIYSIYFIQRGYSVVLNKMSMGYYWLECWC